MSFNKLGDLATAQGNLPEAQRLVGESLRIRQRDLWVSHWRVANVLEQLDSPDAMAYWRQAHDTLVEMASAGLFVSPQDQQFLQRLRAKVDR